jgi:hypothetical protein
VANVDLRLGRWRVGVRPDTDASRGRLGTLLAPYVDTSGEPTRTNFSIRGSGSWWRRAEAQLFVAGDLVRAHRRLDPVVHHLVGHLAGIAAEPTLERDRTVVAGRLLARGDRAVLVTASCTGPIDTSQVPGAPADLVERPVWQPVVDPVERAVVMPPMLADLDWRGARLAPPPAAGPDRLELVGVVTPPDRDGAASLPAVWSASRGRLDEWGVLLGLLDEDGRAVAAHTKPDVLAAAGRLLA